MDKIIYLLIDKNGLLYTIFAAVTSNLMNKLLLKRFAAPYPSNKEYLKILHRKFKIYRELYYGAYFDFDTGEIFSDEDSLLFLKEFYQAKYLSNPEFADWISPKLQQQIRNLFSSYNSKKIKTIKNLINKDYRHICKELKIELAEPQKAFPYSIIYDSKYFYVFGTLCSCFSLISIPCNAFSEPIAFILVVLSVLCGVFAYLNYFFSKNNS